MVFFIAIFSIIGVRNGMLVWKKQGGWSFSPLGRRAQKECLGVEGQLDQPDPNCIFS